MYQGILVKNFTWESEKCLHVMLWIFPMGEGWALRSKDITLGSVISQQCSEYHKLSKKFWEASHSEEIAAAAHCDPEELQRFHLGLLFMGSQDHSFNHT